MAEIELLLAALRACAGTSAGADTSGVGVGDVVGKLFVRGGALLVI